MRSQLELLSNFGFTKRDDHEYTQPPPLAHPACTSRHTWLVHAPPEYVQPRYQALYGRRQMHRPLYGSGSDRPFATKA
jgi:hypothetical protein